jgi:HK97 gp10 family phage protein
MVRFKHDQAAIEGLARASEVRKALLKAAQIGAEGAARRAPVETGKLRDSYGVEETPDGARFGSDLDYSDDVEFGTVDTPAQPHARPAVDDIRREMR